MKLYNILREIKIQKPGKVYFINPEFKDALEEDWEENRYEYGEDTADAIYLFNEVSPDGKIIKESDMVKYLEINQNSWGDSNSDDLINFLLNYNIIQPKLNEIKIQKPDPLYKEKQNLIKVIEADKEIAPGEEYIEDMEYTIEDIKSASSREELINIIEDHVLGDKNSIKYYIDLMDGNERLYEIKIEKPISNTLPNEYKNEIKKQISDIIKEEIEYGYDDNFIWYYFNSSYMVDIFENFIIDQMIFSNYEIYKNSKEILVSHNNKNIINDNDIINYIDENENLKKFLKSLLIKFYYDNVEINNIYNASLKQVIEDRMVDEDYFINDVEYSIYKIIDDYLYTFEDVLDNNDLEYFLEKQLLQSDIINEIKLKSDLNESKPCWKGYKQIGTKMKGNREVPNCIPIKEYNLKENDTKSFLEYLKSKSEILEEAEYQGRKVQLNKPMQGDVKKFKVYVKNKSGRVVKVNFGAKGMNIKKNNPKNRKAYCARSKGIKGGGIDKTKANYWSRKAWKC